MSDYQSGFQSITELIQGTAQSLKSKFDSFTFKLLVNGLKHEDYTAVVTTIEQLAKEKNPMGIPPLYFVYKAHPIEKAREKAWKAIEIIGDKAEVERLVAGKETEDAVKALIMHYGNFKQG
jgi:hypothetical protein